MPQFVVYVIAEYVQKEHVAENMQKTAVQKSVCYELPQKRVSRRENKLLRPGPQHLSWLRIGPPAQQKHNRIYGYDGVIGVWRSVTSDICANRQQHNRINLPLKKPDDSKGSILMALCRAGKT
jgi:hypothetical protein